MTDCPSPRTIASGELICPACGRIWDEDDGPPVCEGATDRAERALIEIDRIREQFVLV